MSFLRSLIFCTTKTPWGMDMDMERQQGSKKMIMFAKNDDRQDYQSPRHMNTPFFVRIHQIGDSRLVELGFLP